MTITSQTIEPQKDIKQNYDRSLWQGLYGMAPDIDPTCLLQAFNLARLLDMKVDVIFRLESSLQIVSVLSETQLTIIYNGWNNNARSES